MPNLRRIRLLPVAIFAAALLFSVKLGALWSDIGSVFDAIAVTRSHAQTASGQNPAAAPPPAASSSAAAGATAATSTASAGPGAQAPAADEPKRLAAVDENFDPLELNTTEITLLQDLAARRQELNGQAQELDLREKTLLVAEQQVDAKIAELKRVEASVQSLLEQFDDEQSGRIDSLVKIYQNMKPKEAARIFMELDSDVLLDVIERMREAKVAPILALMDPQRAKDLTVELAERRRLPETAAAAPSLTGN